MYNIKVRGTSMKKALIIVIAFLLLFSFCACSAGEFISASKLENIKAKSGIDANPVATVTLRYTDLNDDARGDVYTVVIRYELLIDKAPITVINFMNLVQDGFYDNTVVDYIGSRYLIAGRYTQEDDKFITKESGYTIKGEFLANGFKVDESKKDGDNAQPMLGSLIMFHNAQTSTKNYFDTASSAFFMAFTDEFSTATAVPMSKDNYAVFAYVLSSTMSVSENGGFYPAVGTGTSNPTGLASKFVDDMINYETDTQKTDGSDLQNAPEETITIVSITLDKDYKNLPANYRKKA